MSRLQAFVAHDLPGAVYVLERVDVRMPLSEVAGHGVVSVGATVEASRCDRVGGCRFLRHTIVPLGHHHLNQGAFVGLITAPTVSSLLDLLRERHAWQASTSLFAWRRGAGMDASGWDDLAAALHARFVVPRASRADSEFAPPDGLVVTANLELVGLRPLVIGGAQLMAVATGVSGATVRTRTTQNLGGNRIPRAVWATFRSAGQPTTWWDGHRFGTCGGAGNLPEPLLAALDDSGRIEEPQRGESRPLPDYRIRFVVRVPTVAEALRETGVAGLPPGISRPALLLETDRPFALTDATGTGFDVPVVTAPRDALALLTRCRGRAFVPHLSPRRIDELDLGHLPDWYAGGLPSEVADA